MCGKYKWYSDNSRSTQKKNGKNWHQTCLNRNANLPLICQCITALFLFSNITFYIESYFASIKSCKLYIFQFAHFTLFRWNRVIALISWCSRVFLLLWFLMHAYLWLCIFRWFKCKFNALFQRSGICRMKSSQNRNTFIRWAVRVGSKGK